MSLRDKLILTSAVPFILLGMLVAFICSSIRVGWEVAVEFLEEGWHQ